MATRLLGYIHTAGFLLPHQENEVKHSSDFSRIIVKIR